MTDRLRFGIMGTGNIAAQFAEGVAGAARSEIVAVGSRTAENAGTFADKHGIANRHASYDALLADSDVDAIYISLPNSMHHAWTLKALAAGKHVLCEKPLAVTAAEAQEMFDAARQHGRLLVEAFMYRSHPMMKQVIEHVRGGVIGRLRLIRASFCYATKKIEGNIRFDAQLAGGGLMDIGCYCVDFAGLIADSDVTAIHAAAHLHETGVDDRAVGTLTFANDVLCDFACGMTVQTNNAALICGDEGYIEIPVPWKPPVTGARFTIRRQTPPRQEVGRTGTARPPAPEEYSIDAGKPLYGLEADDFAAAALDAAPPAITPDESLRNARILDELRRQAGLAF